MVWRRTGSDPPWVATYAFRDPPKAGVLGIQVDTGDVTGDGEADALVFENTGGSGACGTWSVIALSPQGDGPTYTKDLCDASVADVDASRRHPPHRVDLRTDRPALLSQWRADLDPSVERHSLACDVEGGDRHLSDRY